MQPTVQQAPEQPVDLSVVVATYGRPDTLVRTLDSLVAQTLPLERFEVVVVVNGPPGETPAVVTSYAEAHPALALRLLVTEKAGAAHARSVGVNAARGRWMTMVDDDDWVSPGYLQRMLEAVRPGILPLVDIADVVDGGEPSFANSYSERFRPYRGRVVPATTISPAMSFNVCKLVPTATARAVGFDERLRSASDTLFWLRVYERTRAMLHVLDVDDAVYYRTTEAGSLSRQETTYDFSVTRRLEAYTSLAEIPDSAPEVANLMLARTAGSLARHMSYYQRQHPGEHAGIEDDVRARGLTNVSWKRANLGLADEVVVLGDLVEPAPGDPLTTWRGIAVRGEVTDVLGTLHYRDEVPWTPGFVETRLGLRDRVLVRGLRDPWQRAGLLAERLELTTERRADDGLAGYGRVRSHDPSGLAHLAAAAYVLRHPGTSWTVEVAERPAGLVGPVDDSTAEAGQDLAELLQQVPTRPEGQLGLELAAALAVAIEVSSEPLREAVLTALAGSPSLERARSVIAVVPPGPVPAWGRTPTDPGVDLPVGRVHVAVPIGSTDALGPALGCLAEALLDLPEVRERLRLHLVGGDVEAQRRAAHDAGLGDVALSHPPQDVAATLALLDAVDAVLLLDGPQPGLLAPAHLPDALVAPSSTWVLAAPGLLLDETGAASGARWHTRTDDPGAAREVLAALLVPQDR